MKTTTLLFFCVILAACVSLDDIQTSSFSPKTMPDGTHSFTFAMSKGTINYYKLSEQETLTALLGAELGNRNYCPKGYEIDKRESVENGALLIFYGHCK